MGHKRHLAPTSFLTGEKATAAYVAIGMRFAADSSREEPNIEDTLLAASLEGMAGDLRVLSMLTDWVGIHGSRVNVDRLTRLVAAQTSPRVRTYWAAIAKWMIRDARSTKLQRLHGEMPLDLLETGNSYAIERRGLDERFAETMLRVPLGAVRKRPTDITSPVELSKTHTTYRWRILMGPSYRADMWAALELDAQLTPTKLAQCTYGSFATAWQVKADWQILHADKAA